jgi:hypothetical protein
VSGLRLATPDEIRALASKCYAPRGRSRETLCELPSGHRTRGGADFGDWHGGRSRSGRWYSWPASDAALSETEAFDRVERAFLHGSTFGTSAGLTAALGALADPPVARALGFAPVSKGEPTGFAQVAP